MELETDYPLFCRLVGGDLGVDGSWANKKLPGKTLVRQVWACDLRSIAQMTGNQEALDCARQLSRGVDFRLLGELDYGLPRCDWKPMLTSIVRFRAASTTQSVCFCVAIQLAAVTAMNSDC